jgi:DNA-binding NarL/FixJ family response regulator
MALKVLLVDDQPSTRLMVQALLEHAGHEVFECSTGSEGLDALSREHFDFAFIDLNLPDMSGLELPGRCADSAFRLPPVLGITSMPTANLMSSALSAGMCGLLRKPITGQQLADAMAAARKVRAPAERVRFGEQPIDLKVLSEIRATGDEELIQRFFDQAVADARRCVEDLGQPEVRASLENWRTTVQTLHGVAVTVGARRLASATADTATLSSEQLAERADELRQDFAKLLEEARVWLEEHVRLLSPRERDCLRLAATGLGTKGIADKLAIAEPTVKFHLNNAAIKLNARGRVQAVAKAVKLGAI